MLAGTMSGASTSVLAWVLQSSSDDGDGFLVVVAGFFIGLFLIYYGFKLWRLKRLIQDTPTETVRSMAVGRTELEGTARPAPELARPEDGIFDAPFSNDQCLHADWKVEEYRKSGNDDDKSWDTIASGTRTVPFWLDDGTGEVLVEAHAHDTTFELSDDNSRRITVGSTSSTPGPVYEFITSQHHEAMGPVPDDEDDSDSSDAEDDGGFLSSAIDTVTDVFEGSGTIGTSTNKRRYTQEILTPNEDVYVFGGAYPRDVEDAGISNESKLAIEIDDGTDIFLISDLKEDALTKYYSWKGPASMAGGLVLSTVALYILLTYFVGA